MDIRRRFPLLPPGGADRLRRLEEHPHAPRFTHPGVDRVTPEGLARLRAYEALVQAQPAAWTPGELPPWVTAFALHCHRTTPFYRRAGPTPPPFALIPTCCRADLAREPWAFVPDDQPLDDLIVYNTSGATGHPLTVPTHPDTLAQYLPLLRTALAFAGAGLEGGGARLASIVQVCWQRQTYTMAGLLAALDWAGFVKINLNPREWRNPDDAARFIEACNPEIITGDPLSFAALADTAVTARPKALVSTAMALSAGLHARLVERFRCPVLDMYSLNESGPVAARAEPGDGFTLLQPELYVEVLSPAGEPCAPGELGEIVLTGGFNRLLPLLRYRTGDFGALQFRGNRPRLHELSGRPPVVYRASDGRRVNNIDVSNALRPWPLPWYALHQEADGRLVLSVGPTTVPEAELRRPLLDLFGPAQPLRVKFVWADGPPGGKFVQFTSDLAE